MAHLLQKLLVLSTLVIFGLDTAYSEIIAPAGTGETSTTGNCSCGGFPSATPEAETEPLISQMPGLVVKCDAEGTSTCKNLCLALATATQAKGPEVVCARLKNAHELKLLFFLSMSQKETKDYGVKGSVWRSASNFSLAFPDLSAFSKICEDPWKYTGMSADVPLCCHDSAVLPCPSTL